MISTRKRVNYTLGYIGLGLLSAAREELATIPREDSRRLDVLMATIELAMAESDWSRVIHLCPEVIKLSPDTERPWITWAYALRELQQIVAARDVLLRAEKAVTNPSPIMDYNLACYYCLLGDLPEARRRLNKVFIRESHWHEEAAHDPDLQALHPM